MRKSILSLKLSQLELAVRLGQLSPQQAIEAACEAATELGYGEQVKSALRGQQAPKGGA